jgi:WD40 repeat protein
MSSEAKLRPAPHLQIDEGPPVEPAHLDAFISYTRRHEDTEFVDRLCDELVRRGKQVWLDRHRIEPAADWRERIAKGISAAKALIFVVSPESLTSSECAYELQLAVEQSKLVVPVVCKDVDPKTVPEALAKPNWIFYRDGDDPSKALDQIVEALDTDLKWRDAHTRLGSRAQEWLSSGKDSSFLLRGSDLRAAETWYDDKPNHKQQPTELHYAYISASRRAASKRQRALLGSVAIALVVAVALAAVALVQRDAAVYNAHVSQSRQLAAEGTTSLAADPDLTALFSLKALRVHYTSQAENVLRQAAPELQLLRTFAAGSPVGSVAYSPDGSEVVAASEDGTARIWGAATGRLLRVLHEPGAGGLGSQNFSVLGNSITSASFSPNGSEVVTASDDTTVRVWDVRTGRQLVVFDEKNTANDAAFSPDGRDVVVAGTSGTADLWDVASGKLLRSFVEPKQSSATVKAAMFSPNGKELLTASDDGTARLWDVASGAQLEVLREPDGAALSDAAFSPDGSMVVTASADGTARIWDAATGAELQVLGLRSGQDLSSASFSPNGLEVVTAGNGARATVWDVGTGEQLTTLDEPLGGRMTAAVFSPDGSRLLTGDNDGSARIWDASPSQLLLAVTAPGQEPLRTAAFNRSGTELVTAGDDGTVRVWDASSGRVVAAMHEGTRGENYAYGGNVITDASFSPDGTKVLTASLDGTVKEWDARTGQLLVSLTPAFQVYSAAFTPDGREIMTANDAAEVSFWDAATGKQLSELQATTGFLLSASLNPEGTKVVTALDDGTAGVWDPKTGKELLVLREPGRNPIGSAVFSPGGTEILTASDDGTARLWDVATGKQLLVLRDPTGSRLYDATFSPDGTKVVTASGSGRATIWDATTGKELVSLGYAQGTTFYSAAFSPNGKEVLTAGYDGIASVWSAALAAPLSRVEEVVQTKVDSAMPKPELHEELVEVAAGLAG